MIKRIVFLTGLEFWYLRRFMHGFDNSKIVFPQNCYLKKVCDEDYNEFPELQNFDRKKLYLLHGSEEHLVLCHKLIAKWRKEYTKADADVTQYVSPNYTNIAYIDGKLITDYHRNKTASKLAGRDKLKKLENKWKRKQFTNN